MYIVFEGTVGTGKSTQTKKLFEFLQNHFPNKKIILTREPGGSEIAEAIRKLVQGTKFDEEMNELTDVYLYASSRAQSLRTTVKPALEQGAIVISDRSFITSLAIQGYAQKIGASVVMDINKHAIKEFTPDLVLFLDLDIEIGMKRTFDQTGDKWENFGVEFYKDVYKGYLEASRLDFLKPMWHTIDASKTVDEVFEQIKNVLLPKITEQQ